MAKKSKQEPLCQQWVHAWEEDSKTEKVYRPTSYEFKLSRRPRESFSLHPDGSLVTGTPAATDRLSKSQGSWELVDNNQLVFYAKSQTVPVKKMHIVSVSKDRLVLKPE